MRVNFKSLLVTLTCAATTITAAGKISSPGKATAVPSNSPDLAQLQRMSARFVPTDITADISKLTPNDKRILVKLIGASRIIDGIFLRQVWPNNVSVLLDLSADPSPEGRARLHYFLVNKGPWSRLDKDKPFIPGVPAKPENAGFYPSDVTKAEIEKWIASLPQSDQSRAKGFFSVIKHVASGTGFDIVPYNLEYQGELLAAAKLLREAAQAATEPTLQRFLSTRADAFLSNDYYASDIAWMELDSPIEPTIGPYEVYEDGWFNYKAAFESFLGVRDEAESVKLRKFAGELQDIENHLPIDAKYRNPKLGALAPIAVVNEVFCSGDANHGVQTAAYNLPNDERITREKGSKRVLLRNVQEAKFSKTLVPISKIVLSPADQKNVAFDAFFTQMLVHELMHGLGPHNITVNGRQTTVRQELKEVGSAFEEAKADISSLFAIQYMIDKGVLPKDLERTLYTTYLVSAFRSIRFGLNEAHGRGQAMQLDYLLDAKAYLIHPDGTFAVNPDRIKQGVTGLTHQIMTIQAEGSYEKAKEMTARLAVIRPEVKRVLDKLSHIPVDIEPKFITAEQLLREEP
jgi:Peptidase family M49